jgi:hypothetical protein
VEVVPGAAGGNQRHEQAGGQRGYGQAAPVGSGHGRQGDRRRCLGLQARFGGLESLPQCRAADAVAWHDGDYAAACERRGPQRLIAVGDDGDDRRRRRL